MTSYSMSNFVSPSLERILQQNAENKRKFQQRLGQRLDATLIGTSNMDTSRMNKDLMAVTQEMTKLLRKSSRVSEIEKTKVKQ